MNAVRIVLAVGLITGCGKSADHGSQATPGSATPPPVASDAPVVADASPDGAPALPDAAPPPPVTGGAPRAVDPAANLPIVSGEIELTVGTRTVHGTLVKPAEAGTWPGVLILAGSGPTDRDWNSKLITSTNGSGRLLAEDLARAGAVVLRFDKAFSGTNHGPPPAELSIDTYRDEDVAALAFLRGRADVRGDAVFVAGHSEGGIHATRLAAVAGKDLAGILYLSAAGRSMGDIVLGQLDQQFQEAMKDPAVAAKMMEPIRAAFADFLAGKDVDPMKVNTVPGVRQLMMSVMNPAGARLGRALFGYDPSGEAAKLTIPVFIFNGGKDTQVDPERDARRLEKAVRTGGRDVTFHLAPEADHVLKHEPRTIAEVRSDLAASTENYNAAGRVLDPDAIGAIRAWLGAHTKVR
ncbi:MAG: lysophospholipase [Deltaproteobacteria bacterium]|nr:lysophospholipase [Deltaproteobacteria bacterium]